MPLIVCYSDRKFDERSGDDKIILMTSTFEVLSEGLLHTTEFGEGLFEHRFSFRNLSSLLQTYQSISVGGPNRLNFTVH
jgi:hypothetical protein